MRRIVLGVAVVVAGRAAADDERFAERTTPRRPVPHTQATAGHPSSVAWWAVPGVGPHEAGGYVGGARLTHNGVLSKHAAATGPTDHGTFGWDFVGFGGRAGRVFLRPSADVTRGPSIAREYHTDGPKLPDPVAARPLRKALLEAKEDREHRGGGHGGAAEYGSATNH